MRASSIALSIALHVTLLLLAGRAVSSSRARHPPSKVVVEVVSRPHSPLVPPAPLPPPPPLRHAPSRATTPERHAIEPPAHATKTPLPTGVQLGNEGVRVPPEPGATPSPPSPTPPVQKDLAARPGDAQPGCSEPASKPLPRSKPSLIEYTAKARADGVEGRLLLRLTVGADGTVQDVAVANAVESTLDAAAIASVKTWTFAPARRCGKPVSGTYLVARRFELGD